MQLYEMLCIIKNDYIDNQISEIVTALEKTLVKVSTGSELIKKELIGRKRLAYPINKEINGFYALLEFKIPSESVRVLNREFELNDALLRHIITRKIEKTPEQLAKEKALKEKAERAYSERVGSGKRVEPKKTITPSRLVQKKEDLTQNTSGKSVQELEEQLDEILKRDIVE